MEALQSAIRERLDWDAEIPEPGERIDAGQSQLLDWVGHFAHRPALYLIHGEREKMEALQSAIRERLDWDAEIPEPGERIEI